MYDNLVQCYQTFFEKIISEYSEKEYIIKYSVPFTTPVIDAHDTKKQIQGTKKKHWSSSWIFRILSKVSLNIAYSCLSKPKFIALLYAGCGIVQALFQYMLYGQRVT